MFGSTSSPFKMLIVCLLHNSFWVLGSLALVAPLLFSPFDPGSTYYSSWNFFFLSSPFCICVLFLGGPGQRKLTQITADSEGYTGSFLKNVSGNCKNVLYIIPIQDELDLSPLPHDDPEFAGMPRARCKKCGVPFPVQFLVLHIKTCDVGQSSDVEEVSNTKIIHQENTG